MRVFHTLVVSACLAGTVVLPLGSAAAQSLLDRPDNISGDWVGNSGTVYFNFIHRFSQSAAPEKKVTNFPTFLIATGIASRGLLGVNYASNSALTPRYPNEWEFFGRYAALQQEEGALLDLGGQVDYNLAVQGVDGEVSVGRRDGPVRLIAVGRVIADTIKGGKTRFAFGGGSTIRLNRFVALAGDAATLTSRGAGEKVAWSAGLHIALPNTPHTLSLHMSNANTATMQGLTRGGAIKRYGFEFTIPITMSRFTSNPPAEAPAAPSAEAAPAAAVAPARDTVAPTKPVPARADSATSAPVRAAGQPAGQPTSPAATPVTPTPQPTRATADTSRAAAPPAVRRPVAVAPKSVNARLKGQAFLPDRIEIPVGSTITWKNLDQLVHTIAAVDKSFTSPIVGTDGSYSHTFAKPGTYPIYCTVHPFMKATVIVK
ncbi:MAG: cupredoxin domain-containing protein [bacterium]